MASSDASRIAHQRANPRISRLWKAMRPLRSVASFLNTGAHPDDETTAMLAALTLREGMRIAFACANRGEGGQNNIGTARGADLGALRTREMQAACDELDMGLYWLSTSPDDPIFDFGFSKSGEETFRYWGRERTVEALTAIIREERPDVVCPTFLDVPGQHGHHRAMTMALHEATEKAADANAYPDQIEKGFGPWQVSKLYLPAWSGGGRSYDDTEPPPPATITIHSGDTDPILGASYSQIGEWSRGHHKTQGMGTWIKAGPQSWPLHRAYAAPGMPDTETSLQEGLPITLADLASQVGNDAMGRLLVAASGAIDATLAVWPDYEAVARTGAVAYKAVRAARELLTPAEAAAIGHRLALKERQLAQTIAIASGLEVRMSAPNPVSYPGANIVVDVETSIAGSSGPISGELNLGLNLPTGWSLSVSQSGFDVSVPEDAPVSDPYPSRYEPSGEKNALCGTAQFNVGDTQIDLDVPFDEEITVLPRQTVQIEPANLVVNLAQKNKGLKFSLACENHMPENDVKEKAPDLTVARADGWIAKFETARGAKAKVAAIGAHNGQLSRKGAAKPGLTELAIKVDGEPASTLFHADYAHTGAVYRARPAVLKVLALKAELAAGLRVAYIGSGNDNVDGSMAQMGVDVVSLGTGELSRADLARFDTIVVGIFAFGGRPDLIARMAEIKEWVLSGGNLVTLYHRPWDNWDANSLPPAYLEIGQPSLRWRVTDAEAEVTILAPKHPVLVGPNKINASDWSGWVKERGLYFAAKWDDLYQPLISMSDTDEAPLTGGLLSAEIGKGRHSHVSLILHHQMDNLVPGGFRLMANLISAKRR